MRLQEATVGDVVHGFDHGAVVALDRGVEVGGLAAQVGAQAARVEDRQAEAGPKPYCRLPMSIRLPRPMLDRPTKATRLMLG
jgi:hypothetical protein